MIIKAGYESLKAWREKKKSLYSQTALIFRLKGIIQNGRTTVYNWNHEANYQKESGEVLDLWINLLNWALEEHTNYKVYYVRTGLVGTNSTFDKRAAVVAPKWFDSSKYSDDDFKSSLGGEFRLQFKIVSRNHVELDNPSITFSWGARSKSLKSLTLNGFLDYVKGATQKWDMNPSTLENRYRERMRESAINNYDTCYLLPFIESKYPNSTSIGFNLKSFLTRKNIGLRIDSEWIDNEVVLTYSVKQNWNVIIKTKDEQIVIDFFNLFVESDYRIGVKQGEIQKVIDGLAEQISKLRGDMEDMKNEESQLLIKKQQEFLNLHPWKRDL